MVGLGVDCSEALAASRSHHYGTKVTEVDPPTRGRGEIPATFWHTGLKVGQKFITSKTSDPPSTAEADALAEALDIFVPGTPLDALAHPELPLGSTIGARQWRFRTSRTIAGWPNSNYSIGRFGGGRAVVWVPLAAIVQRDRTNRDIK